MRRDLEADLDGGVFYVVWVFVLSDLLKGGMCAGASGEPEIGVQAIRHVAILVCCCVVAKIIEMKKRMRSVM